MKRTFPHFLGIMAVAGALLITSPDYSTAQSGKASDTTVVTTPAEESSSFQDSVRFDDMDPIFYEAEEDEPAAKSSSKGLSIPTIAIVLVVVLGIIIFLVKRFTPKKK